MRTLNKVLALALLGLAAPLAYSQQATPAKQPPAAAAAEYKYKSPKLSRAQLDAYLAKPGSVVFLDVRRPDEVSKIGGFPAYLSIQVADLEKYQAYIPKDRPIVTVSNHAGRAGAAADLLASKGFKIAGAAGVELYEADGGTLTKVTPPPAPAGGTTGGR